MAEGPISIDELNRRLAAAELALRQREARRELLVGSLMQAVWETDAAGVVVADSPSWRAYTGQTLEEWLGYGWLDAVHPEDRAYAERQWREAVASGEVVDAEFRLRAPGGGWRWTNVRAAPLRDARGVITQWVGINIDVGARKDAEQKLREREREYRSIFASLDEGFCLLEYVDDPQRSLDYRFVEVNEAFEKQTGLTGVVGKLRSEVSPDTEDYWIETYAEVARTGVARRVESHHEETGRWYDVFISRVGGEGSRQICLVFKDTTERKRAEEVLRESEERKAFLLKLSDAVRPLADPAEIHGETTRLLRERLNAGWCYYVDWDPDRKTGLVLRDDASQGLPSLRGDHDVSDAPEFLQLLAEGPVMTVDDYASCEQLSTRIREKFTGLGFRSMMVAPLVKEGRLIASLLVGDTEVRDWSASEASLLVEIAERTWAAIERGRAEMALRESEERFRQFAAASAGGLWIRDAHTLVMEFASPAIGRIYGIETEALLGDVKEWGRLIVPEDRSVALEHLELAKRGETAVHEFRIQRPSDGAFRWVRDTAFALRDDGHVPRIGGIVEDITETRQLTEHQGVLLSELQHRVRNIMGMIRSIANRTSEGAEGAEDYRELLEGRLLALARVQALLMRQSNIGGSLRDIVHEELDAQAHHGNQFELIGPDVMLSPKAVEVLTLAFHELATNALKYGALSAADGRVIVNWAPFEKRGTNWLTIDWREEGAPMREPSSRIGFGSELIEARIPYELDGTGKLVIQPGGAHCHSSFPSGTPRASWRQMRRNRRKCLEEAWT